MTETNGQAQLNLSLDQFCVVAAYERLMRATEFEVGVLRNVSKSDAAEKLGTTLRHLAKNRDEYVKSCQTGIVIASAGSIPDLKIA